MVDLVFLVGLLVDTDLTPPRETEPWFPTDLFTRRDFIPTESLLEGEHSLFDVSCDSLIVTVLGLLTFSELSVSASKVDEFLLPFLYLLKTSSLNST